MFVRAYFFFQAEDGIRDGTVTGVQTCALPIYTPLAPGAVGRLRAAHRSGGAYAAIRRSEERRVGKEGRSRWSPYQLKKKKEKRDEGEKVQSNWVSDRHDAMTHLAQ